MKILRSSFLCALAFFGTLGAFSFGYSAYVSNYPSTATAGITPLSANEWNKMVSALQTIDANLSAFSISGSKVGIGVNPNAAVLDLKGTSWNQLDPLLIMRTNLNPHANISFYQNLTAGQTNPAVLNGDSAMIFSHDASSTTYTNGLVIAGWSNKWWLKIMEDGNVGIGTASPQATLDVNGKIKVQVDSTVVPSTSDTVPESYKFSRSDCNSNTRGSIFVWRFSGDSNQDGLCACMNIEGVMEWVCFNP